MKSEIRNPKSEIITEVLLILLLVFTPIAFGSQVLWGFSLMKLGILLIIILGAAQVISNRLSANISQSEIPNPKSAMPLTILLLSFSLMIFLFRNPRRKERFSRIPVLIFGLAVLWAAWIGVDAVISRFFTAPEAFMKTRWLLWMGAYGILMDFPVLDSGLGTFPELYSVYRPSHILGLDIQAENDFLQLTSEVGFLGVVPLLVLFFFLFFKVAAGIRSLYPEEPQRYIGIGGLVGILALMFHSIVQKNLQLPANAFLYTVIWAMVLQIALDSGSRRLGSMR
ncbi:MAG: O-antigen ligase family protein [Thermodesulfobacteriota bacterium]